jgi:hypothetical protein
MSNPDFFSSNIVYKNDKEALLDLCLRNAFRFAIGEIKYDRRLGGQLKFAVENSNKQTRQLLIDVFKNRGLLDGI